MQWQASRKAISTAVAAALLTAPAGALALPAAGVLDGDGDVLVTFDTATASTFDAYRPITGLQSGERIQGLDYRFFPATFGGESPPALFALGVLDAGATDTLRLYVIDQATGAATPVGSPVPNVTDGTDYGMDFDPASDRIRVVNDADANLRLNPNNGALSGSDTALNPAGRDVEALAYDRVDADPATNTTAFALANLDATMRTVGGPDRSPSPNLGQLFTVGPLGSSGAPGTPRNFDVAPGGSALVTLVSASGPTLMSANTATGALTPVAPMPFGLRAFAVLPVQTVHLSAESYGVVEGQTATITATRSGGTSGSAIFDYTVGGTSGTVTMAPGEAEKSLQVPVPDDATDEADQKVAVTLSNPRPPLQLGAPAVGSLTIADNDPTPAPAPPPAPTAAPDNTAPGITINAPRSASLSQLRKGLTVRLTPSEPAALQVAMQVTPRSARISAFDLTLALRSLPLAGGTRSVKLRPSRKLLGKPRRTFRLRLLVTAVDGARNRATATRSVTVRVPKRR